MDIRLLVQIRSETGPKVHRRTIKSWTKTSIRQMSLNFGEKVYELKLHLENLHFLTKIMTRVIHGF